LLANLVTALVYPAFQRWIEFHILGMPLPPARVLEHYAAQIVTSTEIERLRQIICDEVMPSFLIRQLALVRLNAVFDPVPVCTMGIAEDQLPKTAEIPALCTVAGRVRPTIPEKGIQHSWVRLVLKLSFEGETIGLCLLGRRDPDDLYSAPEISTLQALMHQTALALKNIEQAEYLHALYKSDIERQEVERNSLALELHDDVLGQMAMLAMSVGSKVISTQFELSYQSATNHIRQIINGLRPAMLAYGLQPALDEMVDEMETLNTGISISIELPPGEVRYSPKTELHLFRIVQQACQNAMEHAQAKTIHICGKLEPERTELTVEDDGAGFAIGERLDLPKLLAEKHFGLAGMYERAALIGAKVNIESIPGHGTRVRLTWQAVQVI
jgi:signal transduction histidine kinase